MASLLIAEVPSSKDPNKKYKVKLDDGFLSCSCPAFVFGRTGLYCKHLRKLAEKVKAEGIETKVWTQDSIRELLCENQTALQFSVVALNDRQNLAPTLARKLRDKQPWTTEDWGLARQVCMVHLPEVAELANETEKKRREAADQLVLEVLGEIPSHERAS